jgi:hypothetical protein
MKVMAGLAAAHAAAEQAAEAEKKLAADGPLRSQIAAVTGGAGGRGFGGRGRGGNALPTLASAQAELFGLLNLLDGPADAAPTGAQSGDYALGCEHLNQALARWRALAPQAGVSTATPAALACR